MPKPSHREKLLTEGLSLVHQRGFGAASVRDIVQAAGVPQGSFTNHFASKEDFALAIIDLYRARARTLIADTLTNDALAPLQRLRAFIDANRTRLERDGMRTGCLLGNFAAESCDHSEAIRQLLVEIFAELRTAIAGCLRAAVTTGDLPANLDCDAVAGFVLSSFQGAILLAKAERDPAPLERFRDLLFSKVLR